ncbi:TPA: hypothetical protein N0F65_009917 [Lagenidium giganteum]|uniref:Cysteine dioxygenase n=1 Tax=Lagenidium giganteum TaxID=4803 RepID=A0AAV2YIC5_9STRA|nr:TPA: hypothetical protein N0F65_009917 [Lagenidium giganteum]
MERKDFPNSRLSLKQVETLLAPVIALCNLMTPEQFGIRAPSPVVARSMNEVHYWKLWESETIDIGIFFMPPNSVIPLHNHPGMSVVTRILYGCANVTSYDLIASEDQLTDKADKADSTDSQDKEEGTGDKDASNGNDSQKNDKGATYNDALDKRDVKWARVSREGDFVGESTMWLDPRRFNLHQIQANSDIGCALLDIMIPPYDNADRDCHHFEIVEERVKKDGKKKERIVKMLESVTSDHHNPQDDPESAPSSSASQAAAKSTSS